MSDSDTSSHRLRLVYLSAAIILYYLAGGRFEDNTVNFPLINIELGRTWVIYGFVWILFAWYCWRFWVSLDNKLFHHLKSQFSLFARQKLQKDLLKQVPPGHQGSAVFVINGADPGFTLQNGNWVKSAFYCTRPDRSDTSQVTLKIPVASVTTLRFLAWLPRTSQFDQFVFPIACAAAALVVALTSLAITFVPKLYAFICQ
ncbi:hypothetical protein [Pseudohongiella acticola]|uniref:hypothetical protein n=1 Tax=Pseudohongiella acticola TaxID=1524254 RepID=UPI0030ED4C99